MEKLTLRQKLENLAAIETERTSTEKWVSTSDSDIESLLNGVLDHESKLSDWERAFVDSIMSFVSTQNGLTPKQYLKLRDVCERVGALR